MVCRSQRFPDTHTQIRTLRCVTKDSLWFFLVSPFLSSARDQEICLQSVSTNALPKREPATEMDTFNSKMFKEDVEKHLLLYLKLSKWQPSVCPSTMDAPCEAAQIKASICFMFENWRSKCCQHDLIIHMAFCPAEALHPNGVLILTEFREKPLHPLGYSLLVAAHKCFHQSGFISQHSGSLQCYKVIFIVEKTVFWWHFNSNVWMIFNFNELVRILHSTPTWSQSPWERVHRDLLWHTGLPFFLACFTIVTATTEMGVKT